MGRKDIAGDLREIADDIATTVPSYGWGCMLEELAYRIDSEMVELPQDADGNLCHVGDKRMVDGWGNMTISRIFLNGVGDWTAELIDSSDRVWGMLAVWKLHRPNHRTVSEIADEIEHVGSTMEKVGGARCPSSRDLLRWAEDLKKAVQI